MPLPSLFKAPLDGGSGSTLTVILWLLSPPVVRAVAVRVSGPAGNWRAFKKARNPSAAVVSFARSVFPARKLTLVSGWPSVERTVTITVPATVVPAAGALMTKAGGPPLVATSGR